MLCHSPSTLASGYLYFVCSVVEMTTFDLGDTKTFFYLPHIVDITSWFSSFLPFALVQFDFANTSLLKNTDSSFRAYLAGSLGGTAFCSVN